MRGNMTIAARLGLAFVLVGAVTAVTVAVGLHAFRGLVEDVRDVSSHYIDGAVQLANIQNAAWELRYGVSQFIADPKQRRAVMAAGENSYKTIDENLRTFAATEHEPLEQALLAAFSKAYSEYREARPRWFRLYEAGWIDEAETYRAETIFPAGENMVESLGKLIERQRQDGRKRQQSAEDTAHTATVLFAVLGGLTLVFAALSAVAIVRSVTRPLGGEPADATAIARRIASGDLTGEIALRPGDNDSLLAAMKVMQDSMRGMFDRIRQDAAQIEALNHDLEARVQARTSDLASANRELAHLNMELESFTHVMAHDLRTSLRAQEGFSRMLLDDYADTLDEQATDWLQRINTASKRMAKLIDDTRDLMKIGRAGASETAVDLSALAQETLEELGRTEPARSVDCLIAPHIEAHGDPVMLRLIVANLLGNAWKYTRPRTAPRIEFGIHQRTGETVYFVRDNGIGFDMAHAGTLFQPFRRLVNVSQYEGTGIGLAAVRRAVEYYGGRIWAEAEPGSGATFWFTLGGKSAEESGAVESAAQVRTWRPKQSL